MKTIENKTWMEFQAESFECALSKGWWDDIMRPGKSIEDFKVEGRRIFDPEKLLEIGGEKVALVHSELSEALEDFRVGKMTTVCRASDGKPEGFPSELADVCIRWWDYLGAYGDEMRLWQNRAISDLQYRAATDLRVQPAKSIPKMIALLHRGVTRAYDAEGDQIRLFEARQSIFEVLAVAEILGIDMTAELRLKQAFNRTRDYRHGGKAC